MRKFARRRRCARHRRLDGGRCPAPSVVSRTYADESEDRAAFADARIAAVHAGLKLNPDQEKLWPPVETAVRDFARLRIDRANARIDAQPDDFRMRRSLTIRWLGCANAPTTWRHRRRR